MYNQDLLSSSVIQVLALAKKEAQNLNCEYVGTEHLLLGILNNSDLNTTISPLLSTYGLSTKSLKTNIYQQISKGSKELKFSEVIFTPKVEQIITNSINRAANLKLKKVNIQFLFLDLLEEGNNFAIILLESLGVNISNLIKQFNKESKLITIPEVVVEKEITKKNWTKLDSKILLTFGIDLTQKAVENKLSPLIGREKEIEHIIDILCQKQKNSILLLGNPGIGKTSIVEGLAQKIIRGDVPDKLKTKYIISFDIADLIAGTKFRGQFEERIKNIFQEIKQRGDIIAFIDEIHQIIGAGSNDRVCDLSNVIKPALSRGELICIGITTLEEYKNTIEKDKALDRRFQSKIIDPPSKEEVIDILNGIKYSYEEFHDVKYNKESINTLVELTDQYIPARYQPDKSICLLDAAGVKKRKEYLKNKKITTTINSEDIKNLISSITNIPYYKLNAGLENVCKLESFLKEELIGQDEPIVAITNTLKRTYAGLRNINKPVGSFLFLGSTGVGKTFTCKLLAEHLFGSKDNLIQIDMSEFSEKHTTSSLLGAPPSYVGFGRNSKLLDGIKKQPYSIILFDELEKAHEDVILLLLQILEEGKITDRAGITYNFKNSIIVMTSNCGVKEISKAKNQIGFNASKEDLYKDSLLKELKNAFAPEFINRIDEVIVFNKLTEVNMNNILNGYLKDYIKSVKKNHNCNLEINSNINQFILGKGYDEAYGARDLKRTTIKQFEVPLADFLLNTKKLENKTIKCDVVDNNLTFC